MNSSADDEPGTARLKRLMPWTRAALAWERAWPRLAAVLTLLALFAAASWLGLWLALPPMGRVAGVVAMAVGLAALLVRAARFGLPSEAEALRRLDRASGQKHRPASALRDQRADGGGPAGAVLWRLHQARLQATAARLPFVSPSPRLAERDRFAVRAAALLLLATAAFLAGPEKWARLAAAFDWQFAPVAASTVRIDAWIDPPAYTAKPPLVLATDGGGDQADGSRRAVTAPVGSTLVVRTTGDIEIAAEPGLVVQKPAKGTDQAPAAQGERRWTLKSSAGLRLRRDGRMLGAFSIAAVPDAPPTIALDGQPTANARGSLTLGYTIADDYGVSGAEADFAAPILHGRPVTGRTLVGPPKAMLGLPDARGGLGRGQTTLDLTEHPWAGLHATLTLTARDEGGNEGRSAPQNLLLPQRPFANPLARALVEQRRNLVLAPDDRALVLAALDGLLIAPNLFTPRASVYLGLYTADMRLRHAKTDDDLREVADLLWSMALRLEDGDLSDTERDLRAAEQHLRDAMARGASQEEIRKLTDELRAALDKFLAQMAEQQRGHESPQGRSANRTITSRDLKSMLDRLDQMARTGDMTDAKRMLDELQSLLENLRNANRNGSSDPAAQAMEQSLQDLDRMTRDQQTLRDETFRDDQRARRERREERRRQEMQNGQQPDIGDEDDSDDTQAGDPKGTENFQNRQEALRKELQNLRDRMKQLGMGKEQGLEDADGAMGEADQSLKQGQRGAAVEAQGRALEGLRRGAQGFARQMREGPGGEQEGQAGSGRNQEGPGGVEGGDEADRDPLDRPLQDRRSRMFGGSLNAGGGVAQRAQQVLDELRRRLADPARPRGELDYLERLLR